MNPVSTEQLDEARRYLGKLLREAREATGARTRGVGSYSSGHISRVENGKDSTSIDLVQLYVRNFGADPVRLYAAYSATQDASRLLCRQRHGKMQQPQAGDETSVESLIATSIPYRVEQREESYRVDGRGVVTDMTSVTSITPLDAGPTLFECSFIYFADKRRGVVAVEEGMGCELVKVEESDSGLVRAHLNLDTSVKPLGGWQTFSYRVRIDSNVPAVPILWHHEARRASRHAMRIQFTKPRLPHRVWRFRGSSILCAEADPAPEIILPCSSNGTYFWDFYDVEAEYVGLAWRWGIDGM